MSDQFSGNHCKQPWLHHCSGQNFIPHYSPFAFNRRRSSYYPDHHHFAINPNYYLAELPPNPNLRIGMWARGGAKAYFRFHGGIGDGCGGISRRNTEANTATARPLQLFEALIPIDFQIGFFKNPVIGMPGLPVEANGGTGVFFPVYPKRIRDTKGSKRVSGSHRGGWQQRLGGRMNQEDIFTKSFAGGEVMAVKECKDFDEIPVELLLPPEWTY